MIAKDELKKENIQEDEIYEKIKYFIKNYKMNTTKSDNVKDIFTIFIDNFYWLKFVLIIFFCKYFFQSKNRIKKIFNYTNLFFLNSINTKKILWYKVSFFIKNINKIIKKIKKSKFIL